MRIVLCDDHRLLGEAFATALRANGHEVLAIATTPDEGYQAALVHDPDVCVIDIMFPEGNGLDAAARIVSSTRCKVLVLSARRDQGLVQAARRAGVAGFVAKDENIDGILHVLDRLATGEATRDLLQSVDSGSAVPGPAERAELRFLTRREREALRLISQGQSTKEIARSMLVAHSTARTHVQNVLTKLGVRSRLQAAALVARLGLADDLEDGPAARSSGS